MSCRFLFFLLWVLAGSLVEVLLSFSSSYCSISLIHLIILLGRLNCFSSLHILLFFFLLSWFFFPSPRSLHLPPFFLSLMSFSHLLLILIILRFSYFFLLSSASPTFSVVSPCLLSKISSMSVCLLLLIIILHVSSPLAYYLPHVSPSVRLSTYISAAPTGRISVKFDIGDIYEILSMKSKFG